MANSYQFDPKYVKRMGKKVKNTPSFKLLPQDRFDGFKKLIELMDAENDKSICKKDDISGISDVAK